MAAIPNKVVIGNDLENPILTFENAKIREVTSDTAVSMIGDELFIDQFTPSVEYEVYVPKIIKPTNARAIKSRDGKIICSRKNYDLRLLPYGTKITYYADNQPAGEFFCKKVERVGKTQYKINAVSAVGLMDKQYHLGNMYHGESFAEVLDEILGDDYEYFVDNIVATQKVFGWLPYDTKRKNLHQLLIAYGVNIIKGEDGKMFFTFLEDGYPIRIPSSRVLSGGSITYDDPASRFEVTEHSFHYVADYDEEVLFDNTGGDAVVYSLVTFDKPIYPDSIYVEIPEGETYAYMTIHARGVNYAYVSGTGILKGRPYAHAERVIYAENENAQVEKVISVEDATLITVVNSEQALARLSEYYFHATTVNEDIIVETEKTGNQYIVEDPFNEEITGFMSKMSMSTSGNRRGSCTFIQNFKPTGAGTSYMNYEIVPLDDDAHVNWVIPASVYENERPTIRVVLIGHGYNGLRGFDGEVGESMEDPGNPKGGAGGAGGIGGSGGRVLIVTVDASNISYIDLYNREFHSVLVAGDSTYSSGNGASRPYGFYDPFSDTTYAIRGKQGVHGGAGGAGYCSYHDSSGENDALPGEDVVYNGVTYTGGNPTKYLIHCTGGSGVGALGWMHQNMSVWFGAGGGGGAAAGCNGGDGFPQVNLNGNAYEINRNFRNIGSGGVGADAGAAEPAADVYGAGGNGGHGGGGGGGNANEEWWNYVYTVRIGKLRANVARGGYGSEGGKGKHGCAIIYY